ncbi:hypothetical protein D1007_09263 [Hordeum vulgare]|nr:hypothetical protein D1007_09263 [Hordeum vulgare]
MKGNADEREESMVFVSSPTYEDLVVKVRSVLNCIDPNVDVKLIGRNRVVESQDKSFELFATKVEPPLLQIDLNQLASSAIHDARVAVYVPRSSCQPPNKAEMNDRAMLIHEEKVNVRANNAHVDHVDAHVHDDDIALVDIYDEAEEIHYNPIGNLDVILHQQDMDRNLPYTRKERGAPLFRDLTLAGKVVVDGGMRLGLLEPTRCPEVGDPKPKDEDENAHLKKGIKFGCLQEFKIWLSDYSIRNHRPFAIDHSDQNMWYIIKCDKEGMASSGSIPRLPCADIEDTSNKWKEATLDKKKYKDLKTPPCWCGDVCKSPPPFCKYFTWVDQEVPKIVQKDQYEDCLRRQRLFEESLQHVEYEERVQKMMKERKKSEAGRKHKEKEARVDERARKLAMARQAYTEDLAHYNKGKGPMFP